MARIYAAGQIERLGLLDYLIVPLASGAQALVRPAPLADHGHRGIRVFTGFKQPFDDRGQVAQTHQDNERVHSSAELSPSLQPVPHAR